MKNGKRVLAVDVLSVIFGIGSWICVSGIFVEVPLLVQRLPEGWRLPSFLSVVIQIANIGPLFYGLCNHFFPRVFTEKRSIYTVLCLGVISTLLLSLFWKSTSHIFGADRSVGIIVLTFVLGMVDCSSRVLYPPFMSKFKPIYLIPYFAGEGLSGLIPALLALLQGVGDEPTCVATFDNITQNITYSMHYDPPLFSIDIFFLCLLGMFAFSALAFHLLQYECIVKRALPRTIRDSLTITSESVPRSARSSMQEFNMEGLSKELSNSVTEKESTAKFEVIFLLIMQTICCFLVFGFLPSIQSFACMPYGRTTYHLALSLAYVANPVVCLLLLTPFVPKPTSCRVSLATIAGFILGGYACVSAEWSPYPPFVGTLHGQVISVTTWILITTCFTYARVSAYALLQELRGKRGLFLSGVATQAGVFVGSFGAFILVNFTNVFRSEFKSCP